MEYLVLGRLEVLRDGEQVDLGAHRQRTLLAVLLTNPNGVVAMDEIIDALWGDDAGADRQNALWVYVSGLRKALEPERAKRTDGTALLTRSPGYLVAAEEDDVDALRFEKLVAEGKSLAETDPAAASLVLGEALAMWRGKAYEDFTYDSYFQNEIARLEELRLEAVEARIDADLKRGMSRELVSELEGLVRQHPLRERLTGQLMLALYRSGRQAESLRAYQSLGGRLAEELGIEPSASLRKLEERIVTDDAGLDTISSSALAGSDNEPGLTIRGYELREKIGEGAFGIAYRAYQPAVGREVAIKVIRPELADDPAFIRRFEAEAQLVARLEHPHIVPLYDYWREPGAAYLVMRLMKGGSLDHVLETSALTSGHAVRVADQLAGALQAAHDHSVVHRDIKPSNILIDDEGNAYLSDFGIAVGPDGGMSMDPFIAGTLAAPYASPEQLADGEVSPASDVYSLGVVLAQSLTGLRGDVAQIRGALSSGVAPVIDKATSSIRAHRYQDAGSFADDFRQSLGEAQLEAATGPRVEVENPYKGLRSFDAVDTADFFGRERLIDRLLYRLSESGAKGRFIALVGPSGGGKSSVVKAGLRPALAAGALPMSETWFSVEMLPAPHPFEELESALLSIAVDPPQLLLERLNAGPNALHQALGLILPDDGSQLLLVIDQFEELFTQVDEETADRFLETVVDAVTTKNSRLRVVATLRADFYDRPLRHRALGELLREGTEVITPMSADELERAISGPAERNGVVFEPPLVARLIHDVADRPSVLPLLQYTLTELFDGRTTSRINVTAYDELGGVSGALVKRAEGLLAGLSASGREAARMVLLRLVTLGEGAEDTRRRVLLTELESLPVEPTDLQAVLDTFGRHRLLSFDRDPVSRSPSVEIAHETMLTEWTRLRDWIDDARQDVRNQRRLAEAMGEWVTAGRSDDYLLRGGRLEQLHGWANSTSLPLSDPEQAFLDASLAERDRVEADERERETRAVEAERRAAYRFRALALVGAVAIVVAGLAVYAFAQQRAATSATEERDSLLESNRLAAESLTALDGDPDLAILLAIEAVRATADLGFATEEAVDGVHWALYEKGVTFDVTGETPVAVRPGPDGPTGVWVLPPADLVAFAESVTSRALSESECESFLGRPCGEASALPADLPLIRGDESYGAVNPGPRALAGTTVEWLDPLQCCPPPLPELDAFTERAGIDIVSEALRSAERIAKGKARRADIINATAGQEVRDLAKLEGGTAVDVSAYLDRAVLQSDFSSYLMSRATVGVDGTWPALEGSIYGLPVRIGLKGLVYYPKPAFEAAGYQVPETLDELLTLSRQMVSDGRTPWCFGYLTPEFEAASGWPGTDLLEALAVRIGGIESYDQWMRHQVPFNDNFVAEAGAYLNTLLFEPGFVRNGPESVSATPAGSSLVSMLRTEPNGVATPECWLYHQQSGMNTLFAARSEIGTDLGAFVLPPAKQGATAPVTGTVAYAVQLGDRPEVRELMRFLASPDFGNVVAGVSAWGGFVSPNTRFDTSAYLGEANTDDPARQAVVQLGETIRDALVSNTYRVDASDEMPTPIGRLTPDLEAGAFYKGMIDHVEGVRSIDQVLADIEAAWVALEAAGGS